MRAKNKPGIATGLSHFSHGRIALAGSPMNRLFLCPKVDHRSAVLRFKARHKVELAPEGGGDMEFFEPVSVPAAIYAAGHMVVRLLPLVSKRANKRAVRLAKAKRK